MDIHEMSFAQEYVQKEKRCIELVLEGDMTVEQIRDEIGYASEMTVWKICKRNGLTYPKTNNQVALEKRDAFIVEHASECSSKELADMFGVGQGTILRVARDNGVKLKLDPERARLGQENAKKTQRINSELAIQEKIKDKIPQFEYAGNYKPNGDKTTLDVRCKACGTVKTIQVQAIRHRQVRCDTCFKAEQEERKLKRKLEKERNYQVYKWSLLEHNYKQLTFNIGTCQICGKGFAYNHAGQKYCEDCRRKLINGRKDKRLEHKNSSITAKTLYERDKGVCWICGEQCDLNDIEVRISDKGNVYQMAGDMYPSVDHIIPVYQGGKDEWDNVRLAHRKCNLNRYLEEKATTPY